MLILSLVALKFSQGQPDEVTQMISIDVSQLFNQLFTHPGGAITFTQGLPAYFKIFENFQKCKNQVEAKLTPEHRSK